MSEKTLKKNRSPRIELERQLNKYNHIKLIEFF